jgi:hypothetical protein
MIAAIIVLAAVIALREYAHFEQTKQFHATIDKLSDKLIAKDFTEYKEMTTEPRVFDPVSNDDEDLYEREIEDNKM